MTEFHTLRPGLLVSMQTSLKGNVSYHVEDRAHTSMDKTEIEEWRTRRTIADREEHERAIKMRTKIRGLILSVCSQSAFGLLCPNSKEAELREAIAQARSMTEEFNATANMTRMSVNVIFGRIAQDDVEAVRAITGEIRSLMEDMQAGVKSLDVKVIRDAANKSKQLGEMLTPEAKGRLEVAIETARKSARKIAKAGEAAANTVDRLSLAKIEKMRTSFLDIEIEAAEMQEPTMTGRNIDLAV
jgi:hypothetical protein